MSHPKHGSDVTKVPSNLQALSSGLQSVGNKANINHTQAAPPANQEAGDATLTDKNSFLSSTSMNL